MNVISLVQSCNASAVLFRNIIEPARLDKTVLDKVSGVVDHFGGTLVPVGSANYDTFQSYLQQAQVE